MKNLIKTCLWFDGQAKEAADYYCSIFDNSKIISENAIVVDFLINGQPFMALNGGPHYKFNEAISFVVTCQDQDEIDNYWEKLTANGGEEGRCGWLKDKYGVSWQIVPQILGELMNDKSRADAVIKAFMEMKKFDIEKLKQA